LDKRLLIKEGNMDKVVEAWNKERILQRAKEKVVVEEWNRERILKRVEEKEYINRCHAVNVCPGCGGDLEDVEDYPLGVILACTTEDCPKFTVQVTK
jgi:hypothetical protein